MSKALDYKAIDPKTGAWLPARIVTDAEINAFWGGQRSPHARRGSVLFTHPVQVSPTLTVDAL